MNEPQQPKLDQGKLLSGEALKAHIMGAYSHGCNITLIRDCQECSSIFVYIPYSDGNETRLKKCVEFVGTEGKRIEEMIPNEVHSHNIEVSIDHVVSTLNTIIYDSGIGKYRVID